MLRIFIRDGEDRYPAYYDADNNLVFADLGTALHLAALAEFKVGVKWDDGDSVAGGVVFTWESFESSGESLLTTRDTCDGKRFLVMLPAIDWDIDGLMSEKAEKQGKRGTLTTFMPVNIGNVVLAHGSMIPDDEERIAASLMFVFDPEFEIELGQFLKDLGTSLQNGMHHK